MLLLLDMLPSLGIIMSLMRIRWGWCNVYSIKMFLIFVHETRYYKIIFSRTQAAGIRLTRREEEHLLLFEISASLKTRQVFGDLSNYCDESGPPSSLPGWWVTFQWLELDIDLRVQLRSKSWPIVKINIWDSLGISASALTLEAGTFRSAMPYKDFFQLVIKAGPSRGGAWRSCQSSDVK